MAAPDLLLLLLPPLLLLLLLLLPLLVVFLAGCRCAKELQIPDLLLSLLLQQYLLLSKHCRWSLPFHLLPLLLLRWRRRHLALLPAYPPQAEPQPRQAGLLPQLRLLFDLHRHLLMALLLHLAAHRRAV